jgi:hypothetical protein
LPAASRKIREAPLDICLVGRVRCSRRTLLRRRERVEGDVDLRRRRGEAAAAGLAHDGVQIPVVEAALLIHLAQQTGAETRRGVVGLSEEMR